MFNRKLIIAAVAALFVAACGKNAFEGFADKNSDAANKEKAQIAINSGDYATAIAVLKDACPNDACTDSKIAEILSTAYMAEAGVDMLTILKNVENNTGTDDITPITSAIGSATAEDMANMQHAQAILNNELVKDFGSAAPKATSGFEAVSFTQEQKNMIFQAGITDIITALMAVSIEVGGFDSNGKPVVCSGDCSTHGAALQTAMATTRTYPVTGFTMSGSSVTTYKQDVTIGVGNFASLSIGAGTQDLLVALNNAAFLNAITDWIYAVDQGGACQQTAPSAYGITATFTGGNFTAAELATWLTDCL